jgi:hypothetical protein
MLSRIIEATDFLWHPWSPRLAGPNFPSPKQAKAFRWQPMTVGVRRKRYWTANHSRRRTARPTEIDLQV